jgi:2-dehydropantoate 2-reductase
VRICVVGAGAIGGYLAGKLALAGHEVSVVARGAHLEAIARNGIKLIDQHGNVQHASGIRARPAGSCDLSVQDLILLSLKAHQITEIAPQIASMIGDATPVVTLQNGLPWWYFLGRGGPFAGLRLESLDPGGVIEAHLRIDHIIGGVVHKGAEVSAPGVIRHTVTAADRFPLGEPDGSRSDRVEALSSLLDAAGIAAPVSADIRTEKWFKLWGNLVWNPVCALTQTTVLEFHRSPLAQHLGVTLMLEARAVAAKLGVEIPGTPQARLARALEVGAVRPSMLQDVLSGRPLEIDALLGVIIELARRTETPVPSIDAVYACAKLLDSVIRERQVRIQPAARC